MEQNQERLAATYGIRMSARRFYVLQKNGGIAMKHSDPTANRAIGLANKEWEQILCLAYRYRTDPQVERQILEPETVFRGIYRRLLTDPIKELEKEVHRIEKDEDKRKKRHNRRGSG